MSTASAVANPPGGAPKVDLMSEIPTQSEDDLIRPTPRQLVNLPVLVLNQNYEPLNVTRVRRAVVIGDKDERYVDLLASEDPWPYNAGEKRGIFVETRYGKGRWIYPGLGLYRQLPEGVPDAFKFFANVLSLPKAPSGPPQ